MMVDCKMIEDKTFCASSYLMYRTLHTVDGSRYCFDKKYLPNLWYNTNKRIGVCNGTELIQYLMERIPEMCKSRKVALALSGGIDSALLAKFMPKGSLAYTFKCVVPGMQVTDESVQAARYAKECGLEHKVIEIYWEDFLQFTPSLMQHKGAPIHSIEVQIYKAALQAKADGCDTIIFGESADLNYGGLSGLLSKDWTVGEFIDRYSYVKPYAVLREFCLPIEPITKYEKNDLIDVHEFNRGFFMSEAMGSYSNACELANIQLFTPYAETFLSLPLDIQRIRSGENKYVIREAFEAMYPVGWTIPPKTPMPRPMNEWMGKWDGPKRSDFYENCTIEMTGDQKWMVWCLESFLNMIEEKK